MIAMWGIKKIMWKKTKMGSKNIFKNIYAKELSFSKKC
jgi:hypothetical protein